MFHVLKSTYLQPPDVVNETRPAHLEWLQGEVAAGRIVVAGRLEDESGAVLLTGDIETDEAQDIVDRDPYTAAGLARYERLSFNGAFRAAGPVGPTSHPQAGRRRAGFAVDCGWAAPSRRLSDVPET